MDESNPLPFRDLIPYLFVQDYAYRRVDRYCQGFPAGSKGVGCKPYLQGIDAAEESRLWAGDFEFHLRGWQSARVIQD